MPFQISVQPSGRSFEAGSDETLLMAGLRQGVGLPYGCKDGACGSCKCKKLSGTVTHGTHQSKALSDEEEASGMVLTCCATAQSDVVLESRQVVEAGAFPIKKMPVRIISLEKKSPDVMLVKLQLPATEAMQYHAGQYVDFLLRDGSRRSYSMANAPHTLVEGSPAIELHIRHMPGGVFTDHVFGVMKERDIQRIEGPQGSFFLREDSDKPLVFFSIRYWLCTYKSHLGAYAFQRHHPTCCFILGWKTSARPLFERLATGPTRTDAQVALCARYLRRLARR
jgi:CDP-4-dehydro-6-deoxyglucose reductase, E3